MTRTSTDIHFEFGTPVDLAQTDSLVTALLSSSAAPGREVDVVEGGSGVSDDKVQESLISTWHGSVQASKDGRLLLAFSVRLRIGARGNTGFSYGRFSFCRCTGLSTSLPSAQMDKSVKLIIQSTGGNHCLFNLL